MRNMSFSMTTEAFRDGSKTVTRRLGWADLKPGDILMGVEKAQGLKRGEKVKRIHPMRILDVTMEPLDEILFAPFRQSHDEVIREGFPDMTPSEFVEMFCQHNKCTPETTVQRIEFEHLYELPATSRVVA